MTDPFDYRDPQKLEFELDLPAEPVPRRPVPGSSGSSGSSGSAGSGLAPRGVPGEWVEPGAPVSPAPFAEEPFSLELEDIARPVAAATPHSAPATRPGPAARPGLAAPTRGQPLVLPQPSPARAQPPAVRTLELRAAEALDRLPAAARGGLLALTMATMLMLGVSVLMLGVNRVTERVEELRQAHMDAVLAVPSRQNSAPARPGAGRFGREK